MLKFPPLFFSFLDYMQTSFLGKHSIFWAQHRNLDIIFASISVYWIWLKFHGVTFTTVIGLWWSDFVFWADFITAYLRLPCEKSKCQLRNRVQLFVTPWTIALQIPLFIEFSRQEYWSGLPFPSPGDLSYPGIKPGCPAFRADSLLSEPPGKLYDFLGTSHIYA